MQRLVTRSLTQPAAPGGETEIAVYQGSLDLAVSPGYPSSGARPKNLNGMVTKPRAWRFPPLYLMTAQGLNGCEPGAPWLWMALG
ncbi:hypothetical protein AEGHOMDF_4461 [Methylobacterium soli]|nr:hypothetical protein AEGHOMDF_4461 [Methylobacterium soli]